MPRKPPGKKKAPGKKRPPAKATQVRRARGWTGTKLAAELEIDRKTITNWLNEKPPCPSHGSGTARRFVLQEVKTWLEERAARRVERAAAPSSLLDSEARMKAAQAQIKELELRQLQRSLAPLDMYATRLRNLCDTLLAVSRTAFDRRVGDLVLANSDVEVMAIGAEIEMEQRAECVRIADEISDVDVDVNVEDEALESAA